MKKLFIDPSATGITGVCLVSSESENSVSDKSQGSFQNSLSAEQITFLKFENKEWKEHFRWIKALVEINSIDLIVCETTTYISTTSADIQKLIRLVGGIEILSCFFPNLKVKTSPSDQTKRLRKKIVNREKGIAGLNYQRGKSWTYQNNNISVHELDAFLIYWIWRGNNF